MSSSATVPQWIAAVGGTVSLLLAFRILLRDRAREVASQAAQIACWRRWPLTYHEGGGISLEHDEVHLHNASDRPITDVGILSRKMTKRELQRAFSKPQIAGFIEAFGNAPNTLLSSTLRPAAPALQGAIMPGETAVQSMVDLVPNHHEPPQYYRRWVTFRDVNGIPWCRDLSDGRLLRKDTIRARYRLRRGWWRKGFQGVGRTAYRHWAKRS